MKALYTLLILLVPFVSVGQSNSFSKKNPIDIEDSWKIISNLPFLNSEFRNNCDVPKSVETNLVIFEDNFIVLDFGTATTFDVIIKKSYKGGVIAPGIKISLNTLSDKATLIPKINLKKIKNIIGIDTISAVRSGFFWGYAGLIDNIVNLIKKESRKSFQLVITGGFSDLFKNSIKTKVVQNKDITIKGLIKISKLIK